MRLIDIRISSMLQVSTIPPKETMVCLNHVGSCFVICTCDSSAVTLQVFLVSSYTHMITWPQETEFSSSKFNVVISFCIFFPVLVKSGHLGFNVEGMAGTMVCILRPMISSADVTPVA